MHRAPHDAFFKRLFSDLDVAREVLRALLPREVSDQLDWSTLHLVKGSFVSKKLRARHTDLLYSIKLKGTDTLAYILFEHQSRTDKRMPFRGLEYMVHAWASPRDKRPDETALPMIIPVVLHQGKTPWTGPTTLHELFNVPSELLAALGVHLPNFKLVLADLGATTERDITDQELSAYARLGLWALRVGAHKKIDPRYVTQHRCELIELARAPNGDDALEGLFSYLSEVLGEEASGDLSALVEGTNDPTVQEAYVTIYDKIRREGLEQGLEQGREQGREQGLEQGREQGRASMLLKLITLRFGSPTEATRARVATASADELDAWAERVLTATTPDDLWR